MPHSDLASPFSPADTSLLDIGSCKDIQQFLDENKENLDNEKVARRYSLSLRSPPFGSLAAELLEPSSSATPHFQRAKSLLTDLKEMTARFSDFESCLSSSDNEGSAKETDDNGFKNMNDRKRGWKNKRKTSSSPSEREYFMRANRNSSPKTSLI